ncbi:MAG: hypothetical protein QHC89_08045 [Bosea sp. (in: a-proteobacteria)]|nr:hypothetical protein [Bosea sp. (in: a-proteobacteria)]
MFCEIRENVAEENLWCYGSLSAAGAAMSDSEKRENFVRLAEGRTQNALDAIRKLGNLSNKRAYDYTDADIRKIAKALRDAVSDLEKRFGPSNEATETFKL